MRDPKKTFAMIAVVAWFLLVAVLALNWVGDHLSDIASGEAFIDHEVAGEVLDPADAPWLDSPPARTRVDTEALRLALDSLGDEVLHFLDLEAPTEIFTSARHDHEAGIRSESRVLTGASRSFETDSALTNVELIASLADALRAAGWSVSVSSRQIVVTEYPIVPPIPEVKSISARSSGRVIEVRASDVGDRYLVTYWVDESHLE